MTVFVTGGAGFIGAHVVRRLLADGADVACYDNLFAGSPGNLPSDPRLRVVIGDVRDGAALAGALAAAAPEAIVHLAAIHYIPYCDAHPDETFAVNAGGTLALFEAAKALPLRRVVVASTAAVYPIQEAPCREDGPLGPTDIYGASKVAAEALAHRFAAETGAPVACARLFNVYGPGETNPHLIPDILAQVDGDRPIRLGNLAPRRDYVHVTDVADAVARLLACGLDGWEAFNVGTGVEYSVTEVVETIGAILGRRLAIESDPPRARRRDRPHLRADAEKIRAATGWEPRIGLRDGLAGLLAAPAGGRVA